MLNEMEKIRSANVKLNRVYFDCNATTPVLPGAAKAAFDSMSEHYGNPSSIHSIGLQSKQSLEFVRKMAAQLIGAEADQIIFMSGATEAIHTAIFSVLNTLKNEKKTKKTKLLYSATEHKAVSQALHHWVNILDLPYEIVELPVNSSGQIILETLLDELPHAALLCTMAVNNETGVIQSLSAIEEALTSVDSEAFWLVDSVQALGKLDMKLNSSRIDYATFSGHKIYAPKGIGFLYNRKSAPVIPLIVGGGQEKNYRSGTENLTGIIGLGYVLHKMVTGDNQIFQSVNRLSFYRDKLVAELKEVFPQIILNTPIEQAIPTTLNFSIPSISSRELLDVFDAAGLCLSGGSACNSHSLKSSHVLDAMGKPPLVSASAVRLSFGLCTTMEEIELGCTLLRECGKAFYKACLLENKAFVEPLNPLGDGILQFQSSTTNTWMIIDKAAHSCVIIDPCEEVEKRIEQYVKSQKLAVLAILDTHSHADHESTRLLLEKKLAPYITYICEDNTSHCSPLGWPNKTRAHCMITLDNLEKVPALCISSTTHGELVLAQLQTPGHTDDSQTFLLGTMNSGHMNKMDVSFVFSGDMILSGGLGRTNFATSSSSALYHSLRTLDSVASHDAIICPAHDYNQSFCTSLNVEIQSNSLMSLALDTNSLENQSIFMAKKVEIDYELTLLEENFRSLVCGVTNSMGIRNELGMVIYPHEVKNFLYSNKVTVIDVSEGQEFSVQQDFSLIGLEEMPLNIPLTRITNLIKELLISRQFNHEILFICRSGERSLQAAIALRRFGFNSVWSLDGGLALARCGLSSDQYSSAAGNAY